MLDSNITSGLSQGLRSAAAGEPPACNTGVTDTLLVGQGKTVCGGVVIDPAVVERMKAGVSVSVDWLRFTLKPGGAWNGCDFRLVLSALGLPSDVENRERGFNGYEFSFNISGGGVVACGGESQAGTLLVELPGSALAYHRDRGVDLLALLHKVCKMGAKVTRLDLAFDDRSDFAGVLSYTDIQNCLQSGDVTMSAHKYRLQQSELAPGESFSPGGHGWTFGLGSRESDCFIRIYNKAAEQGVEGHWIRVESELKGDLANTAFHSWARRGFLTLYTVGFLRSRLDFKQAGADSNKARLSTAEWWQRFLGAVEKVKVVVSAKHRTVADLYAWAEKTVAPTLAVLREVIGDDILTWLADSGKERLKLKHRDLIALGRADAA